MSNQFSEAEIENIKPLKTNYQTNEPLTSIAVKLRRDQSLIR